MRARAFISGLTDSGTASEKKKKKTVNGMWVAAGFPAVFFHKGAKEFSHCWASYLSPRAVACVCSRLQLALAWATFNLLARGGRTQIKRARVRSRDLANVLLAVASFWELYPS